MPSQEQNHYRRLALVTGGTGAIGKAIALEIALQPEYRVVLLCRDAHRAGVATNELIRLSGNECVSCELVDLSSKESVQALAERFQDPVHVLVNNAAVTPRRRRETPAGIELQFATNVLGYFWLTRSFKAQLQAAAPARHGRGGGVERATIMRWCGRAATTLITHAGRLVLQGLTRTGHLINGANSLLCLTRAPHATPPPCVAQATRSKPI